MLSIHDMYAPAHLPHDDAMIIHLPHDDAMIIHLPHDDAMIGSCHHAVPMPASRSDLQIFGDRRRAPPPPCAAARAGRGRRSGDSLRQMA